MKKISFLIAACAMALGVSSASAAPITFSATGVTGVSGYITFDTVLDGSSFQMVSNSTITALSMNVFGQLYDLGDVATSAVTFLNSTGSPVTVVNGGGNIADNGVASIAFFPDGYGGSGFDGDASLAVGNSGQLAQNSFYAVRWVEGPVADVPEPEVLGLMGLGLAALALARRRRAA